MKLTSKNVNTVFMDCLFKDGEDTSNPAIGEAVMSKFGFNRERLAGHTRDIVQMLSQLPDQFMANKGGGWSFLNACMTADGDQWGEHMNIDQLIALGGALGVVKFCMPRDMWKMFPGGMPYFVITIPAETLVTA